MTLTGIVLIIITVALCIMVLAFIPTLIAVKRAAISLNELSDMVRTELKPAIHELTAALTEVKTIGSELAGHTDDVKLFMTALGKTGDNLNAINRSVELVTGVCSVASAWTVGAKVAGKYLLERYLKKRGGK
jgi:uncharacterized protein YoxC